MGLMNLIRGEPVSPITEERTQEIPARPEPVKREGWKRPMSQFVIEKNVERPANLPNRQSGVKKYPVDEMEVNDFFRVPKEEFMEPFDEEKYDAKKHRNRVNQSVRNAALNINQQASKAEGFNPATYVPVKFTVAVLDGGDIGVWRDS